MEDKPWKNEELEKLEEALAKAGRVRIGTTVEAVQGKDRSGMRRLPPESSFGLDKRNETRNRGVHGEGGAECEMVATSLHNDVLLDTEECYE